MSALQPLNTSQRFSRSGRELTRLAAGTELVVAEKGAIADVEAAALDALKAVTTHAMQDVAFVAQVEQHLAAASPDAEGRLRALADIHAIAAGETVLRASRRLG